MQSSVSGEGEMANISTVNAEDSNRNSSQEEDARSENEDSSSSSSSNGEEESQNSCSPSVCSGKEISTAKSQAFDYNQYLNQENKENQNPLSNYLVN
jgi:hypothetical protein